MLGDVVIPSCTGGERGLSPTFQCRSNVGRSRMVEPGCTNTTAIVSFRDCYCSQVAQRRVRVIRVIVRRTICGQNVGGRDPQSEPAYQP